jgi:hypothetical protein
MCETDVNWFTSAPQNFQDQQHRPGITKAKAKPSATSTKVTGFASLNASYYN